jgi:hypothetical protein
MKLSDRAIQDFQRFTGNKTGFFGVDFTIKTPDLATELTSIGLHNRHHNGFDSDGRAVNSKVSSLTVAESVFIVANYPYLKFNDIDLENHVVTINDAAGRLRSYVVQEYMPDETIGSIVLILGVYGS